MRMIFNLLKKGLLPRFFLAAILFGLVNNVLAQTYGLKFNAQNVTLDKRTELDLIPNGFLKVQDEFDISFDYKTTRIKPNSNIGFFGYVFRIITKEDKNIDLLSTPTPEIGLNLVIGESNKIIPAPYPDEYINNWINLRVKFQLAEDRLIFYTPDTFYVQEHIGLSKNEQVKIIFGVNDYKHFKNSDVPSMTIKDVKISEKGKLKFNWALNEKDGLVAIDKLKGKEARVINPLWVTLDHQNWQKIYEHEITGFISITADTESGNIYMVGKDSLRVYSTLKNSLSEIKYKNQPHFLDNNYRVIFNSNDKQIYCYVVDNGPCYSLNPKTGQWNDVGSSVQFESKFRHHNSFYNASDNSIYIFGGYGIHKYNNEILKIDLTENSRKQLHPDKKVFSPRYLAGLAALNDTVYILGGYGSQSGNQLINPQSYFDLVAYSIKDGHLFNKFEIPHLIDDMIVGNSFWIDKQTRNYYALIYSKVKFNGELQLIQGHLDTPEVTLVGNKIPFQFLDIRSFATLFYMPTRNKLYSITYYTNNSKTKVSVFSIDNPPNKVSLNAKHKDRTLGIRFYIVLFFIVISAIALWIIFRMKKVKSYKQAETDALAEENEKETLIAETPLAPDLPTYNLILFGGFQVFNQNIEDITNKFSPLLKELFLLILLHTFKNNKGISSDKITEVLWYDKSEKSARNNRSVNMAKLRTILEEIGSCELSKKTGYWKINFEEAQIKGDYIDFLHITASKNNLTKQLVNQLIEISGKGAFLSNVHYEWLDEFKASVSDTIIDTLVEFGQTCDVKEEADFIIHLADSIFNFDMINEDAMFLKCKAQYCMGKHSHAKATYEKFFKEYVAMYGQEYEQSFLDILDIKE